jgi:uncharacterized integral membrane protein (TIGR00697 family)
MLKIQVTDSNEQMFLILSSIFVGCLVCSNLILQKFFTVSLWGLTNVELSVGIIPYPITFLCTDLISEIYGRKKADQLVIAGFVTSLVILIIVSIANFVPATEWSAVDEQTFNQVFGLFTPAVIASLLAYLTAQFIDIRLFHFWKNLTQGKHLWLRNNGSTIISQIIDTSLVLAVLCFFQVIAWDKFSLLFVNAFIFKLVFALLDTPFFYLGVWLLQPQNSTIPDSQIPQFK